MNIYTCIHTYIHTHTYIYIYIYIYIYKYICLETNLQVQRRQNDILLDEHDYDTLDDYVPSNRFQQVSRARQSEHSNTHYGRQSTNTRKHRHTMNDDPKERITKLREKREGLANEMLRSLLI